jgi:heat shock protein HtpX
VAPVLKAGLLPPVAEGFGQFTHIKSVAQKVSQIIDQEAKESRTNPYDSHPSLRDRLSALEKFPAGVEIADEPPAISLLENVPQLELELMAPIAQSIDIPKLTRVNWDEVLARVYIPFWESTVRQQGPILKGITPEAFPEIAKNISRFEERVSGATGLSPEQRLNFVTYIFGAALTLALVKRGWRPSMSPGGPVVLSLDGKTIHSFGILPRLMSDELPAGAWSETCDKLGIRGTDLGREPV